MLDATCRRIMLGIATDYENIASMKETADGDNILLHRLRGIDSWLPTNRDALMSAEADFRWLSGSARPADPLPDDL